ncbi:MAG: TonB-dependent receptor, partial [bacterium]|nr:TonB-dependent receptor [bacterium]
LTGLYGAINNDDRSLLGIDYTHMFSPTFLMEVRGGFSRNSAYNRGPFAGQDIASELGLPNLIPDGESAEIPELLDWPRFRFDNHVQVGTGSNQPVQYHVTDIQGGVNFTWIKGSHVIKSGFHINRVRFNQPYFNNQRGSYRFGGRRTGHPIADLQLGWLHNVNRQAGFNRNYWRQTAMGAFVNDDWKATRNLTLNLGVRWEVNKAPYDRYDRLAVYVPDIRKHVVSTSENTPANYEELLDETGLRDLVTTAEAQGYPRTIIETDWLNFSPRVGFAWRVFGSEKTVIRGGYGIFMAGSILNNLRNNLSNQFPFAIVENF